MSDIYARIAAYAEIIETLMADLDLERRAQALRYIRNGFVTAGKWIAVRAGADLDTLDSAEALIFSEFPEVLRSLVSASKQIREGANDPNVHVSVTSPRALR